ncbi:hypothetical protein CALVIDRAFT_538612 [Calocera viscosa TUFC12733]|uniref:Uncharacterized protein n=1 Tax=Calocera viscosa (strain TUFC12733) TaxID=1330018 RepID=A0A167KNA6_CALVF|nr:hypothetical protein CALVIDRAFT_538612 [Calocera viscosa TUFC12733]
MAPPDIREHFAAFLEHFKHSVSPTSQAATSLSSSRAGEDGEGEVFTNFWEAPERFWEKGRVIDDAEMEAIDSGGASKW